jgi:HK97 family phage portal protein
MSVLAQIARVLQYAIDGAPEKRSSLENPQTPLSYPAEWLLDIFNGGRTDSGVRVSELTALQVSTVLCCVNIISNAVSSMPLRIFEKSVKDGLVFNKVAHNHALYELLHTEPNPEMTSVTFRKTLQSHMLLWGNGYAEIQRSEDDNSVIAIWPRNPARTRPVRLLEHREMEGTDYPAGTMVYETNESIVGSAIDDINGEQKDQGQKRIILAEDMLHIPGLSLDGRLGQPTVQLARQVIGLALATEKYSAKFFANNARPAGILSTPGALADKAKETLKRSWAEGHGGENAHKTAVLEQGVTYTKIAATPDEAQQEQSRKFQRVEIANVFNVPARMVDGDEHAARSTAEQSAIELLNFCLNPWLASWEAELKRKLFSKMGRSAGKYHAKFDTRQLMYPDAASRATFYNGGKMNGYLNTDDIRELEGLNPVLGLAGQMYWRGVNYSDASLPAPDPNGNKPAPEPEGEAK